MHGAPVPGYLEEEGMPQNSTTESAFACKMYADTDRWQGVPIYVRLGKRMTRKVTDISIHFKEPFNQLFQKMGGQPRGNILTLRITPNEGIIFRMHVKQPGLQLKVQEVPMRFYYKHVFQMDLLEAYVKLIHDAIQGDATLFPHASGIEEAWKFVQPLLERTKEADFKPEKYAAGTWGPASFTSLITDDGKTWS
jgi:glucose-6-phosphate 1-dehydrogenase